MNPAVSHDCADGRDRSRTTAALTGAAVLGVCFAYVGWSLLAGRSDEIEPTDPGIELGSTPASAPELSPPEAAPVARLTLDDGTALGSVPVMNAHHEFSAADRPSDPIAPAVQQLGFVAGAPVRRTGGAWLTGVIEPVDAPAR